LKEEKHQRMKNVKFKDVKAKKNAKKDTKINDVGSG